MVYTDESNKKDGTRVGIHESVIALSKTLSNNATVWCIAKALNGAIYLRYHLKKMSLRTIDGGRYCDMEGELAEQVLYHFLPKTATSRRENNEPR